MQKSYYELIFRLWLYIKQFQFIFSTNYTLGNNLHVQWNGWDHYTRLWRKLFMPNRACVEVCISAKKLLWVDFMPLALNKIISIHFLHKVIPGKWSTCTMTWLIPLPQTVAYIIYAEPCMRRSVHFGKTAIMSWFSAFGYI